MYSVDRFFNMISSIELNDKTKNLDVNEFFQILLLVSIYQNYVILNERNNLESLNEEHHLYKDFFKISERERVNLKNWLINAKTYIEIHNPVNCAEQSSDVLMVCIPIICFYYYPFFNNDDHKFITKEDSPLCFPPFSFHYQILLWHRFISGKSYLVFFSNFLLLCYFFPSFFFVYQIFQD